MKCGYVALIGRPNVGKSTLMNHLIGQKISITSRKPQTTRHRIFGIKTSQAGQLVFIDTPGIHQAEKKALNQYLNKTASSALAGVNVIVWLLDRLAWRDDDALIFSKLNPTETPVVLVLNKVDKIKNKPLILDFFNAAKKRFPFHAMLPLSALQGTNLQQFENTLLDLFPESGLLYPEEQITDRSMRFMAAEIVREKLTRRLGDELPYAITVEIERYEEQQNITKIYAIIWVEKSTQKSIVIGKQGEMLKKIGSDARVDIEKLIAKKVYLRCWVKVKKGWSNNERALQSLGFIGAEK